MNSYSSIRIWLYSSAAIPMPYRVIQIFDLLVLFVAIPCLQFVRLNNCKGMEARE